MQRATIFLLALLGWLCSVGSAWAALVWEQQNLNFEPGVSDNEVVAHFKFQNTGGSAIAIKSVIASCSCTTVTASKQPYASGERGEIIARFLIGDRVGVRKTEVAVATDEVDIQPAILSLEVKVPKIAEVDPDPLRWLPGSPLQPKRIRIIAANGVPLKLLAVKSSDPGVSAKVEPGVRPGEFILVVTPREEQRSFSGILRIETDFPKDHPKALLAHVQVTR